MVDPKTQKAFASLALCISSLCNSLVAVTRTTTLIYFPIFPGVGIRLGMGRNGCDVEGCVLPVAVVPPVGDLEGVVVGEDCVGRAGDVVVTVGCVTGAAA